MMVSMKGNLGLSNKDFRIDRLNAIIKAIDGSASFMIVFSFYCFL